MTIGNEKNIKYESTEDEINLIDIIKVLWKRRLLIGAGSMMITILALLGSIVQSKSNYQVQFDYTLSNIEPKLEQIFQKNIIKGIKKKETIGFIENKFHIPVVDVGFEFINQDEGNYTPFKLTFLIKTSQKIKTEFEIEFNEKFLYPRLSELFYLDAFKDLIDENKIASESYAISKFEDLKNLELLRYKIKQYQKIRRKYGSGLKGLSSINIEEGMEDFIPINQQIIAMAIKISKLKLKLDQDKKLERNRIFLNDKLRKVIEKGGLRHEEIKQFLKRELGIKGGAQNLSSKIAYSRNAIQNILSSWRINFEYYGAANQSISSTRSVTQKVILAFIASLFMFIILAFILEFFEKNKERILGAKD